MFKPEFVTDKSEGGARAAKLLDTCLRQDAARRLGICNEKTRIRVYSFCNFDGFTGESINKDYKENWPEFVKGFNASGVGMYILDTDNYKESADHHVERKPSRRHKDQSDTV
jgi:hypothetical protein